MAEGGGFVEYEETLSTTSLSQSSENLDLDLEELDDIEYDIPPVDNPPTLESILNEPDEASDEETSNYLGIFGEPSDTISVASTNSIDSKGKKYEKRPKRNLPQNGIYGSILRHVILRGISSQLISATERINAGMPTAMAASLYVAVGTSHGLVLLFDSKQVLKWCLGSVSIGAQYGSVSALSFNNDCTRLLCGFAKGAITMWDLTNGKLLRTILDAHPPGSAVLHIKFTDDSTLAVCSDSGGSVFELNFRRVMGVRSCDSRCLFSGSRGEVCAIQALQTTNVKDHPLQEFCILAMATLSKVIVVSIRPRLKVLFSHALPADPSTLPILAWQFVIIQVSSSVRIVDPVFSFGRESTLYFFQVSLQGKDKILFIPLKKLDFNYIILNFTWLNPRTLVVFDTTEHLHIIDVRTQDDLEIVDLADVQLVYGSSHFKGLSTGGNVSKAMAYVGERACYQSVVGYNGQLLLLGTKSVHLITIRSWKERLEYYVRQNKFREALMLAQSFFQNKGKAIVGLFGSKEEKMIVVGKAMWDILETYVEYSVSKGFESSSELDEDFFNEAISICIEYHLLLENGFSELEEQGIVLPSSLPSFTECLFGKVYNIFKSHPVSKAIFLETLEVHILNNEFASRPLPPSILHDFVEHFTDKELYHNLESCIVHMNIANLDLHQVLTLCWTHSLYDAIFYIHNRAMHDYTGPLEELLAILQESLQTGKQLTDLQIMLGNKILVYISCSLAGRAYPIGYIPPGDVPSVKEQVFKCLITRHSINRKPKEPLYPHLRTFLHFDTREFLNVLALAFEEPEFDRNESIWRRQDVVDILIDIMHNNHEFSPTQVGSLFTFLARQMAKHESTIIVNRSLFEQVLEYVTNASDESRHEERQQALLELHAAGGLKYYDEERLLQQAERAQFYRVCEILYMKRKEYKKILPCYLQDPARKLHTFSFVKQIVDDISVSTTDKESVKGEVMKNIEELLDIDNLKTARLMIDCFPEMIIKVADVLEKTPKIQWMYLQGIFECREIIDSNINGSSDIQLDPYIVEKYIDLICQFSPHLVHDFVKMHDDYRLEETLKIVQNHKIMDAAAFILEKLGRAQEAFSIMIKTLESQITETLKQLSDVNATHDKKVISVSSLQTSLLILIQFCQRNSAKMTESEREILWFQLLDSLLVPLRHLDPDTSSEFHNLLKESTTHVLNSMMGYIKLPVILEKILKDPNYKINRFSEIRDLLIGMLDTYNYEKTLLQTTKNLLHSDLYNQLAQLRLIANRSFAVHDICCLCHQNFKDFPECEKKNIIIFRCGHSYHISCLKSATSLVQTETKIDHFWIYCHLCQRRLQGHKLLNRRISVKENIPHSQETPKSKAVLNKQQIEAIERLRQIHQTGSRLAILRELARKDSASSNRKQFHQEPSIFQRDDFALRLAPPHPQSI